jgi:hypothetical protein
VAYNLSCPFLDQYCKSYLCQIFVGILVFDLFSKTKGFWAYTREWGSRLCNPDSLIPLGFGIAALQIICPRSIAKSTFDYRDLPSEHANPLYACIHACHAYIHTCTHPKAVSQSVSHIVTQSLQSGGTGRLGSSCDQIFEGIILV